jgi:hypothetical protein
MHAHMHTRARAHTLTHTRTHARTHVHTYTRISKRTRAHTHTHTHLARLVGPLSRCTVASDVVDQLHAGVVQRDTTAWVTVSIEWKGKA